MHQPVLADRTLIGYVPTALLVLLSLVGYGQPDFQWEQRASFPGAGRWAAFSFEIDGYGYVAGGDNGSTYLSDLWRYDPQSDTWSQRASMPGARKHGTAWSVNGKGYVTCGQISTTTFSNMLWEYDPALDSWAVKASMPGAARYGTHGFALYGYGYLGGGNRGTSSGPFLADMWRYDPLVDQWEQVEGIPSLPRYGATSFATINKGYVYGGLDANLAFTNQFWEYEPVMDSWVPKNTIPGSGRSWSMAMPTAYDAVVACGAENGVNIHEAFRFDPGSNVWTGIAPYPGESGWSGASFELNGRVFGGLGRTIFPMSGYHTDWWEMVRSNDVGVQEDTDIHKELRIFPNPSRSGDMVRPELDESMLRGPFWMSISDASGRLVTSSMITNEGNLVPDGLAPGLYRLSIVSAGMIHTATLVRLR